jgi:glycosyltransferase involved in cell wall biosynthesis
MHSPETIAAKTSVREPSGMEEATPEVASQDKPLISVVINCYNHGRFLGEAITSVENQTYRNYEIIVVDDGSTDSTAEVSARYGVRYHYQENAGISIARNVGTKLAKGDYILFLDADDRLRPDALEISIRYLLDHPDWAFISGNYIWIDGDGNPMDGGLPRGLYVGQDHYEALLRANYVGMHATVLYRREPLMRCGGYTPGLRGSEDYQVFLKIAKDHPVGCHPRIVAEYRRHHSNTSHNPALMLKTGVSVIQQIDIPRDQKRLRAARRAGLIFLRRRHGFALYLRIVSGIWEGRPWRETLSDCVSLIRLVPPTTLLSRGTLQACYRRISGAPFELYSVRNPSSVKEFKS